MLVGSQQTSKNDFIGEMTAPSKSIPSIPCAQLYTLSHSFGVCLYFRECSPLLFHNRQSLSVAFIPLTCRGQHFKYIPLVVWDNKIIIPFAAPAFPSLPPPPQSPPLPFPPLPSQSSSSPRFCFFFTF